jgi:hypothetical protein
MKKSKGGRKPIEVIESLPLSQIIFLISAGINYPEAISKARQTDSSATIKQLSILETKEFVSWKKSEDKLLNKTIYFVKWEKVIEEFMKKLNWQKDRVLEQAKQTNSDYETKFNQQITYFKYFEDKDFLDMLPKNIYLQKYLSVYFSQMPSINMSYTISDLLGYILLVGNFNFVSFGNLNISRVAHFIEQQNAKEIPADIIGIPEKDWHEIDKKKFEQQLKEQAKNIGKSFESSYNKAEKRIKEIQEKDLQLRQLTIYRLYLVHCNMNLLYKYH